MSLKLTCNKNNPPIGALAAGEYAKNVQKLEVEWKAMPSDSPDSGSAGKNELLRRVARSSPSVGLYDENDPLTATQIDHWLSFSLTFSMNPSVKVDYLNKYLASLTYLVSNRLTIADLAVFNVIYDNQETLKASGMPQNVQRWYDLIFSQECVQSAVASLPDKETPAVSQEKFGDRKQEGKFVELPGAEMGKVVVRFPPEASGYLHIGHAKAALLNQYYQEAFQGKLIMRFDDTNPAKENVHFEQVILEDLKMLQIKPDVFTHTSQYFDLMLEYCEKLLREGKAYVDDTEPEQMKKEREQRIPSANRSNSVEKNFSMWQEMVKGSAEGQKCCVRAKIDMGSPNGCLRDPTIYRCKNEPHPRTGTQYKVYPTYDFACPIVDAIENVTHTLRTMEYHDRDDQFYWFIEALGLRRPMIWEYSRLNMTSTVLSKRKLTWFVDQGFVDGWDDPRFPTVRGILRRGMTVEGLKQFIIAQGSSKSVVFMEWDKIWAFNKKVIDPVAPRYTALEKNKTVVVNVEGAGKESLEVPAHPKNESVGMKKIDLGPQILIDQVDAETLKEGENATFINWGNLLIKKINRDGGTVTSIDASLNLDNKDYKKTVKLTWLAKLPDSDYPPTFCVYFEHIISKPVLGKEEDFKEYVNRKTRTEVEMLGDPELKKVKVGDIIQLQRRGFFRVDVAYKPKSEFSSLETPVILFAIPDGHTKEMPTAGAPKKQESSKETASVSNATLNVSELVGKITDQGKKVRELKASKAQKADVEAAVKILLNLKADYKTATGQEWKPGAAVPIATPTETEQLSVAELNEKIIQQGDSVRSLKANKAKKADIEGAVQLLLSLKSQYKAASGQEWKPGCVPATATAAATTAVDVNELSDTITTQGNTVRNLKGQKAPKNDVDAAVNLLLSLKAEYKAATGSDWKPPTVPVPTPKVETEAPKSHLKTMTPSEINQEIIKQGEKVRKFKGDKADKALIEVEVKALLALKADYKSATGQDWKPGCVVPAQEKSDAGDGEKDQLTSKINAQGDVVRNLKSSKAPKGEIDDAVKILLDLKGEYKKVTGTDFPAAAPRGGGGGGRRNDHRRKSEEKVKGKKSSKESTPTPDETSGLKKVTRLGLEAKKEENLPEWYSQVITKGELIEYYDVSGCYILRHWSFAVWKAIKTWFDAEITKMGVKECYFPIFVSRSVLEKEKTHIADFAPEVAWVTKSGESDLAEPIAVRPTSETVMYPAYAKWIQSHRDLPLRLNQWNNVVRWEFKHPQPFLRTREFLWQEGHTAFMGVEEAHKEVYDILDLYAKVYTDLLAVPVVKGRKTEKEKFAGGDFTTTVEAFISASGRAIQGATSHHLGQNFSKMFEIVYEDPETKQKQYVFQNSWGITTRTIGVMIMVHADNQGLVLPPRVAGIQAIVVPCGVVASMKEEEKNQLIESCKALEEELKNAGVRVEGDYRDNYSPGWKFNHWELKGVPLRIELGPKDFRANQLVFSRRDTGFKIVASRPNAVNNVKMLLEKIHENMLEKATKDLNDHMKLTRDWSEFVKLLDAKNIILSPFCGDTGCEDKIKDDSQRENAEFVEPGAPSMGAKTLCVPFEQPEKLTDTDKCIHPECPRKPMAFTLFGRSY
uniref:Bifunctional glutamate/proline--tRNA ligase n=1 Tax=Phlebotomus kandelakii TaxID=1109342 RepID=A0A6B2E7J0_9DIPT